MYWTVTFRQRRILSDGWFEPYSFHIFSNHNPPNDEEIWGQRSPEFQQLLSVKRATRRPYVATRAGWRHHLTLVAKEQ